MTSAETQLAELRAELERERASRQDWAAEALRLDVENEQLRVELAAAHIGKDAQPNAGEAA